MEKHKNNFLLEICMSKILSTEDRRHIEEQNYLGALQHITGGSKVKSAISVLDKEKAILSAVKVSVAFQMHRWFCSP
jgi:hypothetical protein